MNENESEHRNNQGPLHMWWFLAALHSRVGSAAAMRELTEKR